MTAPFLRYSLSVLLVLSGACALQAQDSNGLAPEVADLNAAAVSYALEAKLPDLPQAYLSTAPQDLRDGIPVGALGVVGGDKDAVDRLDPIFKTLAPGKGDIEVTAGRDRLGENKIRGVRIDIIEVLALLGLMIAAQRHAGVAHPS